MGRAIEQSSTERTDYRFPLAIDDSFSAADLHVELRFKAVGGKIDRAGGIAVRLADADNYYVVRANALEGLSRAGIDGSGRVPLHGSINSDNRRYLAAKATRAGHQLDHILGTLTDLGDGSQET